MTADELERAIAEYDGVHSGHFQLIIDAAKAHLATMPRTQWRVRIVDRYCSATSTFIEEDAAFDEVRRAIARGGRWVSIQCVTGPHMQEVPA